MRAGGRGALARAGAALARARVSNLPPPPPCRAPGPEWDRYKAILTGRELRRRDRKGHEEVGVVLYKVRPAALCARLPGAPPPKDMDGPNCLHSA